MEDRKDKQDRTVPLTRDSPAKAKPTPGDAYPPGTLIADRYRVLDRLGVGGMGVVYSVYDTVVGVKLALKTLRPEMASDEEFLERFRNELILARRVTHRHVVRNHDLGLHRDGYYMTMDLVEGRSLRQLLAEQGRLEPQQAIRLARQIASALAEAHRQGIVHRDLKPANILIDSEGDAFVTDFGIARSLRAVSRTLPGSLVGTPAYLAPEQARGEEVDQRSDLYSLGIILIEMLTGKRPFADRSLAEILAQKAHGNVARLPELGADTPAPLAQLIRRCLEALPEKRYQSAEEILEELDDVAHPGRRAGRRRRVALGAVAVVVFVLVAFGVGRRIEKLDTETEPPEPRYSIAVLPLAEETGDPSLAWASTGLASRLATALADSESLRVVDDVRVFQVFEDLGLSADRIRREELAQVASVFQVDRLVAGRLRRAGDRVQLDLELLDPARLDSPQAIGSEVGEVADLAGLTDTLGRALRELLDLPVSEGLARPTSATAMEAYAEGLENLSQRQTLLAVPALQRAVAQDPDFTIAWVRLSQAYQSLGRYEEALEAARRGVESSAGSNGRVDLEALAQLELLRGETERAHESLQQLVERFPNDSAARIALGEAYAARGLFPEALASLREAVRIDPSDPRAWYLAGQFAIQSGDSQVAVDDYLVRALEHHTARGNEQGRAEVYNAFGVGYLQLGRVEEAVASFRASAEIRERIGERRGLAVTLYNLARIHLQRAEYEAAEERIKAALAIHTELNNKVGIADLTNAYGALEEERGRYGDALGYYREALQLRSELGDDRGRAESSTNVGSVYHLLGEEDNALLYLREALELVEANQDAASKLTVLSSLAITHRSRGDWTESLNVLLEALESSRQMGRVDSTAISLLNLGRVSQLQGRYRAALSSWADAEELFAELELRRGLAEVALWRAQIFLALGAREELERQLESSEFRLLEESQNHEQRSAALIVRARRHLGRGELVAAQRLLDQAREETAATQSPALILLARMAAAGATGGAGRSGAALDELSSIFAEAQRLGRAVPQLEAGEALAEAALESGDLDLADETVRQTLRVAARCGTWARTFQLHQLTSRIRSRTGDRTGAAAAWQQAQSELARVRDNLDEDLRQDFDKLPEVAELLGGAAPGG